jgi:hypothetical protein
MVALGKAKINQGKEMKCNTANNKFKSRYKISFGNAKIH